MILDLIAEQNVWDFLSTSKLPIVVYGMGDGAEKIINILKEYSTEVDDIFASDEFVRGHTFLGKKVMKYSEVCDKYKDFTVVMAFAIHDQPMLNRIKEINQSHAVVAPDVPVAGNGLFTREFVKANEKKFDIVYNNLADDRSKEVFLNIINFKISGKVDYLYRSTDDKESVYKHILRLNHYENIVDLGAYDGDTIKEFLSFTEGNYNNIVAVEADEKNFKKMLKNTAELDNIECHNLAVWSHEATLKFCKKAGRNSKLGNIGIEIQGNSVDNIIKSPVSLIKMDIEGSELQALSGAENTIKKYFPNLYVCAYHRNEDMFAIPLKIWEMDKDYKIYFRHSPYIPAWESNFYCTNPKRTVEND